MAELAALLRSFLRDTRGATAIEYALIAVLVGIGVIVSLFTFGGRLFGTFNAVGDAITNALS